MLNIRLGVHKQPCSPPPPPPPRTMTAKLYKTTCIQNSLNNLEPVTSHQDIKGVAQSDKSGYH